MMRFVGLVILALCSFSSFVAAEDKFNSEQGRYSALFPAKPTESTKEIDAPVGKLTINLAVLEVKRDLGFIITYVDYPESVKQQKPQELLARTRDGAKGAKGIVLDDNERTLDGKIPGRDYILTREDGGFYRARVYLDGSRLYQLIVASTKATDVRSPEADKFLDSFEVAK